MDLKDASTWELIAALSTRKGVVMSRAGLYQPYELTKRYDGSNDKVEARILIVRGVEEEY